MKKDITNIFINSATAVTNKNATFDGTKIYSININTPPIVIKNKANLKVANICHCGDGHSDSIFIFKIDGIQTDYSRYLGNDGSTPTIIATTFNNTRNLYEENDIPLLKQTINEIKLSISTMSSSNANAVNVSSFTGYFSITAGGSSYLTGQILKFTGGNGDDIYASINANAGVISNVTALNVGTTYNAIPTLTTYINGSGAILTATITSGAISAITIVNGGLGYKVGQTLAFSGGGGSGTNITVATVSATGAILTVTITSGGSGFTSAPVVSVSSTTITQTATITPLMNYGVVTDGIKNTINFCISLKIEEEINE